ncbi:MAG: hypothetical protein AMXMBFR72_16210 [Betaproteobacteria bacterium]|nr:MAG: hypothetical protein BroJett031_12890 [Betaproteobacteria bacterium]
MVNRPSPAAYAAGVANARLMAKAIAYRAGVRLWLWDGTGAPSKAVILNFENNISDLRAQA